MAGTQKAAVPVAAVSGPCQIILLHRMLHGKEMLTKSQATSSFPNNSATTLVCPFKRHLCSLLLSCKLMTKNRGNEHDE